MGSSAASNPGTSWRKTKIGLSALALTLGIAAVVPFVIDDKIDEGVRESVLLDPRTWSDTAEQNFYNQTTHEDFYVFNLTNLYAVLTQGDKPNFQEVGPIRTRRCTCAATERTHVHARAEPVVAACYFPLSLSLFLLFSVHFCGGLLTWLFIFLCVCVSPAPLLLRVRVQTRTATTCRGTSPTRASRTTGQNQWDRAQIRCDAIWARQFVGREIGRRALSCKYPFADAGVFIFILSVV
jgi:hypothetical protein